MCPLFEHKTGHTHIQTRTHNADYWSKIIGFTTKRKKQIKILKKTVYNVTTDHALVADAWWGRSL